MSENCNNSSYLSTKFKFYLTSVILTATTLYTIHAYNNQKRLKQQREELKLKSVIQK